MPPLTAKQRLVLRFIWDYKIENGWPPTVREIGKHFGINSPNGVVCHLKALEEKGRIVRSENISRGIRLLIA